MSNENQETRTESEEFAIIHNSDRGQVLVFKEPEKVNIVFHIDIGAVATLAIETGESCEVANKVFENLKDFENVRVFVNDTLEEEYL